MAMYSREKQIAIVTCVTCELSMLSRAQRNSRCYLSYSVLLTAQAWSGLEAARKKEVDSQVVGRVLRFAEYHGDAEHIAICSVATWAGRRASRAKRSHAAGAADKCGAASCCEPVVLDTRYVCFLCLPFRDWGVGEPAATRTAG